ncbi:hypothetical protein [Streptomyces lydicus]|uniref:hypothetical protein n=1 Tax=Streptomyces lydicus TaxID=47763 RepID=UPI0036EB889F
MALSVTACSGPGSGSHDASPSPQTVEAAPSTGTRGSRIEAEKPALLDIYKRYWTEQVKAYGRASDRGTDLQKYATTQALSRALSDLQGLKASHRVLRGVPQHDAEVTSIGLDKKVPDTKVTDCLDVSDWRTVTSSGKTLPAAKGVLKRDVAVASAEKWGSRWMITKIDTHGRAC